MGVDNISYKFNIIDKNNAYLEALKKAGFESSILYIPKDRGNLGINSVETVLTIKSPYSYIQFLKNVSSGTFEIYNTLCDLLYKKPQCNIIIIKDKKDINNISSEEFPYALKDSLILATPNIVFSRCSVDKNLKDIVEQLNMGTNFIPFWFNFVECNCVLLKDFITLNFMVTKFKDIAFITL